MNNERKINVKIWLYLMLIVVLGFFFYLLFRKMEIYGIRDIRALTWLGD